MQLAVHVATQRVQRMGRGGGMVVVTLEGVLKLLSKRLNKIFL